MTTYLSAIPAYGRDYKSIKEVTEAYDAGKDFIIQGFGGHGQAVNKQDVEEDGTILLKIRYARLQKVVVLPK